VLPRHDAGMEMRRRRSGQRRRRFDHRERSVKLPRPGRRRGPRDRAAACARHRRP
jgi:hypothetical protein